MGWSFRQSFNFGSAAISTGPRGTYVTLDRHGIRYRQRITSTRNYHPPRGLPPLEKEDQLPHTITSANINELTDSDSQAFVDELNTKAKRISYFRWFCVAPAVLFVLSVLFYFGQDTYREEKANYFVVVDSASNVNVRLQPEKNSSSVGIAAPNEHYVIVDSTNSNWNKIKFGDTIGYVSKRFSRIDSTNLLVRAPSRFETNSKDFASLMSVGGVFFIFLGIVFRIQDRSRLLVEIYYTIDDQVKTVYDKFLDHFRELLDSRRVWQYLHAERTSDFKHHAGAGTLVTRIPVKRISSNHKPASFFRTNILVPNIKLKNTDFYFLPERLLIKRKAQFAAVFYRHLTIQCQDRIFVEEGGAPPDALVVGHTWKFPNKDGSPDGRFNNNRQIPECQYSLYHFVSGTGVNEMITTSKRGVFHPFVRIVEAIGKFQAVAGAR